MSESAELPDDDLLMPILEEGMSRAMALASGFIGEEAADAVMVATFKQVLEAWLNEHPEDGAKPGLGEIAADHLQLFCSVLCTDVLPRHFGFAEESMREMFTSIVGQHDQLWEKLGPKMTESAVSGLEAMLRGETGD